MFDIEQLKAAMSDTALASWCNTIDADLVKVLSERVHGDEVRWETALRDLPAIDCDSVDMSSGVISISAKHDLSGQKKQQLKQQLETFIPWRKGPFEIHGIFIDTEWHSDWKWQRLVNHIQPLTDRLVLDVGCGSGYHAWRMADAGARLVIGIDPGRLFFYQYKVIKHFLQPKSYPFYMLPFGIQHMPGNLQAFDTVFSMGILYHRKSPLDHLQELKNCLRAGGELVLETIVIDGPEGMTLLPHDRYAKMRNVWFIPSVNTLVMWMQRVGYKNINVVDVSVTSVEEQRRTDWMRFESLSDFLDPEDQSKTVEGYPAPKRAVIVAKA